jgi:hypothetical protein
MHGELKRGCRRKVINDANDGKFRLRNGMSAGLSEGRRSRRASECRRRWKHVRVRSSIRVGQTAASPLEELLERADVELRTDSESAIFCRTPRTPEQSAATCVIQ